MIEHGLTARDLVASYRDCIVEACEVKGVWVARIAKQGRPSLYLSYADGRRVEKQLTTLGAADLVEKLQRVLAEIEPRQKDIN